jgi:hypothetical protein
MFLGGGVGCCVADVCLVLVLSVEDPLVTLANPYDLIVSQQDAADEILRESAANAKKVIIRQYLIKKIGEIAEKGL